MIKSITVKNHLNKSIKIDLTRPEESGFIVKSINGLGPAKASINTSDIATTDGGMFNSARLDKRNITLSLQFYETGYESIEDIRKKSYKYFPVKKNITFIVETDTRTLQTSGYVESNEPDIFSKESGCNISIICPDPFWYTKEEQSTIFSGVKPLFEFPFENNSLTEPLIELGSNEINTEQNIIYDGDADVGVSIHIHAIGDATNLKIANTGTGEMMVINTDKLYDIAPLPPMKTEIKENFIVSREDGKAVLQDPDALSSTLSNYKYSVIIADIVDKTYISHVEIHKAGNITDSGGTGVTYAFVDESDQIVGDFVWSSGYFSGVVEVPDTAVKLYISTRNDKETSVSVPRKETVKTYFASGDDIVINTQKGNKNITLTRYGIDVNILNTLEKGSDWFSLVKGDNVFAYVAETGGLNLQFRITNKIAYDGV